LAKACHEIGSFYKPESDNGVPVAYLWARTVTCPNPGCRKTIPLYRRTLLSSKKGNVAVFKVSSSEEGVAVTVESNPPSTYDAEAGTVRGGSITCPFCNHSETDRWLQAEGKKHRISEMPLAVVTTGAKGKRYRAFSKDELERLKHLSEALAQVASRSGLDAPSEPISDKRPSANSRGLSAVTRYGMTQFKNLYNQRQQLALLEFCHEVQQVAKHLEQQIEDDGYRQAVVAYLSLAVGRLSDFNSTFCTWSPTGEFLGHTFTRHALGMVWDYAEVNPFSGSTGDWAGSIDWITRVIEHCSGVRDQPAQVRVGDATKLPLDTESLEAVLTDPPYYDSVPYADISDYFYVWLKRALGQYARSLARTPLTPKASEVVMHSGRDGSAEKAKNRYEEMMGNAFREQSRVLKQDGISLVVFAHRTTAAWETLIGALQMGGLVVSASWPLRTERGSRMIAQDTASLASSIVIICRKRRVMSSVGLWDDVRSELKDVAKERLEFFWSQGIRGADFFISAIGPALSVFGKYERVTKLSGDEVTVGQFLDEVRGLVTAYALSKIMKTIMDPENWTTT
jgi:adenine-specific DNA methylase